MKEPPDFWYIRLPDGRVLRAASTAIDRQHLETGRLPVRSMVRRSSESEWATLAWTREFADLAERVAANGPAGRKAARGQRKRRLLPSTVASRLDPQRLQLVGV